MTRLSVCRLKKKKKKIILLTESVNVCIYNIMMHNHNAFCHSTECIVHKYTVNLVIILLKRTVLNVKANPQLTSAREILANWLSDCFRFNTALLTNFLRLVNILQCRELQWLPFPHVQESCKYKNLSWSKDGDISKQSAAAQGGHLANKATVTDQLRLGFGCLLSLQLVHAKAFVFCARRAEPTIRSTLRNTKLWLRILD